MSARPYTLTGKYSDKTAEVKWETVSGSDTGDWFPLEDFNDNTVHVTGTFDSNTLTVQGSNDKTNAFTLTDNNGLAVAFTAAGGKFIAEAPKFIRLSSSSGASADLDVIIKLRKA